MNKYTEAWNDLKAKMLAAIAIAEQIDNESIYDDDGNIVEPTNLEDLGITFIEYKMYCKHDLVRIPKSGLTEVKNYLQSTNSDIVDSLESLANAILMMLWLLEIVDTTEVVHNLAQLIAFYSIRMRGNGFYYKNILAKLEEVVADDENATWVSSHSEWDGANHTYGQIITFKINDELQNVNIN